MLGQSLDDLIRVKCNFKDCLRSNMTELSVYLFKKLAVNAVLPGRESRTTMFATEKSI